MSVINTSNLVQFQKEARNLLTEREGGARRTSDSLPVADGDRVSLGQAEVEEVTYSSGLQEGKFKSAYELLRSRLVSLLQDQGVAHQVSTGNEIDIASLTPEEAQALVAEDGFFGVEQTSERIFQFALGLAGNDPARFEEVLRGIEDGFSEAERIWGETLPEISYQTRDALMDKIHRWQEGLGSSDGRDE